MRFRNDDGTINKYVQNTIETKQAPGSYFGFDSFNTGSSARDKFQIKGPEHGDSWSDARLKGTFDTLQLYDKSGVPNAKVPLEKGGIGPGVEPYTKSYPQYGSGGVRQLVTDQTISFDKVEVIPK